MIKGSLKQNAYRNVLVAAINEGLRLGLFTLSRGVNGWPDQLTPSKIIDFNLPNGLPARVVFSDIGFGELSIVVAVNPKDNLLKGIFRDSSFRSGDAFAHGWLEREKGTWLQSASTLFNCRRNLISVLAGLNVEPNGFSDHGVVMF